LIEIMMACTNGTLADIDVKFKNEAACCVIMASDGYPGKYSGGFEITRDDGIDGEVYVAGAKLDGGKLLTAGGRVLGVVAIGEDLGKAIDKAYKNVEKVHFGNAFFRKDIGQKAMAVFNNN
jgi:phosphoribosylamine--glycine ligase